LRPGRFLRSFLEIDRFYGVGGAKVGVIESVCLRVRSDCIDSAFCAIELIHLYGLDVCIWVEADIILGTLFANLVRLFNDNRRCECI
jgi:hypothetical protein